MFRVILYVLSHLKRWCRQSMAISHVVYHTISWDRTLWFVTEETKTGTPSYSNSVLPMYLDRVACALQPFTILVFASAIAGVCSHQLCEGWAGDTLAGSRGLSQSDPFGLCLMGPVISLYAHVWRST